MAIDYALYDLKESFNVDEAALLWDDLHALADGHEPVLLCHEHLLKLGDWCHRRMVVEWFEEKLGVAVPEMAVAPKTKAQDNQLNLLPENA